ncbi:permease, partial [Clostridium perfringens]
MNHSSDGRMAFDHSDRRRTIWFITIFIIIAATGLTYVKWWPYYDKALKAIMEHSIGSSI